MTLIEGVGDEVTIFACILVVLIVLALAWVSTSVTDRPFVSVIVLDGRTFHQFISRFRGRRDPPPEDIQNEVLPGPSQISEEAATGQLELAGSGEDDEQREGSGDDEVESPSSESTPLTNVSEGFVHLGESSSDGENNVQLGSEQLKPEVSSPEVSPPANESELRQRRLAYFDGSTDLPEGVDNATAPVVTANVPQFPRTVRDEPVAVPNVPLPSTEQQRPMPDVEEDSTPLEGHIRIRLKYLDDRQRWVQARPEETIGQFKRAHFSAELGENTIIRFIYNGRELTRDGQSLAAYNVSDESVIHCLVSQGGNRSDHGYAPQGTVAFDMGSLVFPLFGLILALIWYSRFTYKQYFNTMSTLTLLAISFLFVVALFASLRVQNTQEATDTE